jgi:sigma-B regulation protein RsbU (phosphoserine phosphatase)
VTLLQGQVIALMGGTVFLVVALLAFSTAAVRGRTGVRFLLMFGIFNLVYGVRILVQVPAFLRLFPRAAWDSGPSLYAILSYLLILPGLLCWRELSIGALRRILEIAAVVLSLIALAGIWATVFTPNPYRFMLYNNLLVVALLVALGIQTSIPSLRRQFGGMQSRVSRVGSMAVVVAAIYATSQHYFHLPQYPFAEPLAFAVFDFTLGYVAVERLFTRGRRLLAIENELAIARELQSSTLPTEIPEIASLRINAVYRPATAVAGDFYEFIPVGRNRVGFLIADVSGHGVPAALIAAMIKIAMQSLVDRAHAPGEVLRSLNRIFFGQLRGQLVSAAYLWLDMETSQALYSAAGHPPLLRWRQGRMERIESNGLLIGITPESDYPVCKIPFSGGDRFLLYTDGVVEPENAAGDSFGDRRLEEILRRDQARTPAELSDALLAEIRRWQPASVPQQDDITLIVIDVAGTPGEAGAQTAAQSATEVAAFG